MRGTLPKILGLLVSPTIAPYFSAYCKNRRNVKQARVSNSLCPYRYTCTGINQVNSEEDATKDG